MPDVIDSPVVVTDQPVVDPQIEANKQELDNQMAYALGKVPEVVAPVVVDPPPVSDLPPAVTDYNILGEKYGWQKPEDAIAEIEELRLLKANPPAATIKYENEQSEKLAKAWQAGKMDEVFAFLEQQRNLDKLTTTEVNKDTASQIIKTGMALKYKDLTPEEINYKFNKQFALPKEPKQGELDEPDEFKERHDAWKEQVADIEMNKVIEAKLLKPELDTFKSKLVIPEIATSENTDYVQWQKLMEDQAKAELAIKQSYSNVTPKTVETILNFKDEANKINFDFQYEPDVNGLNEVVEMATDIDKFIKSYVSDGKFDKEGLLKDLFFMKNRDKMLTAAMNQSKNATLKSLLPDNSQTGQRQFLQNQEPNELDLAMQQALGPHLKKRVA